MPFSLFFYLTSHKFLYRLLFYFLSYVSNDKTTGNKVVTFSVRASVKSNESDLLRCHKESLICLTLGQLICSTVHRMHRVFIIKDIDFQYMQG